MSFRPSPVLLPVLAPAALLAGTCAHLLSPATECRSDFDCKLERVCDGARCVWPSRTGRPAAHARLAARRRGGRAAAETQRPPSRARPRAVGRPGDVPPGSRCTGAAPGSGCRSSGRRSAGPTRAAGSISSSPAVSKDGWVVVGSQDGKVHLIAADGKSLWAFPTTDMVFGSPAIGVERHRLRRLGRRSPVRPGSQGAEGAVALPAGGLPGRAARSGQQPLRRRRRPDHRARRDASTSGGDGVYALNPDGSLKWRFATGGPRGRRRPACCPTGPSSWAARTT